MAGYPASETTVNDIKIELIKLNKNLEKFIDLYMSNNGWDKVE